MSVASIHQAKKIANSVMGSAIAVSLKTALSETPIWESKGGGDLS